MNKEEKGYNSNKEITKTQKNNNNNNIAFKLQCEQCVLILDGVLIYNVSNTIVLIYYVL